MLIQSRNLRQGLIFCFMHLIYIHSMFPLRQMKTRPGEVLIDCLDSIEDTKGNNGDRGARTSHSILTCGYFHWAM